MDRKIIYRKILIGILMINIVALIIYGYQRLDKSIPNDIKLLVDNVEKFDFSLPIRGDVEGEDINVVSVNNTKLAESKININFTQPFTMHSSQIGQFTMNVKLFGIIPLKKINVDVIDTKELIPSGMPIGIYVETDGVMVLGTSPIQSIDGLNYDPALNILKSGDYITKVNNRDITNKNQMIEAIQGCGGDDLLMEIRRNQEILNVKIQPVETAGKEYKIGTWIRDNTQGIGTLTYINKNGTFGALGHGITDIDTSMLMEIDDGSIYTAKIMMIVKGEKGTPGEIVGLINQNQKEKIGQIKTNSNQGIFGELSGYFGDISKLQPLKIALKQEVQLGKAYIRCQVEGEMQEYEIEIERKEMNNDNLSKGLVIKITDERLLSATNGIVQGMSGSPIIQNNKLIGAVTHVFIQDSTKGYGIFIENMLNASE